jgi:hypothetical protein
MPNILKEGSFLKDCCFLSDFLSEKLFKLIGAESEHLEL